MEQVINIAIVLAVGVFAGLRDRPSVPAALTVVLGGGLLILAQFAFNWLLGGLHGDYASPLDVLYLRGISYSYALAVFGYIGICAGAIGVVRALTHARDEHDAEE
ncbi:hypothetical protein [Usitatibacter palustris]|uniref:hypothetical protein n=1 Tax=Usitatibacter palustris TaxID=2732487 RepID=UPI001489CF5E|nr:hypothetical protein [Usitatibacter palustris]